jgi:hypothetical protein
MERMLRANFRDGLLTGLLSLLLIPIPTIHASALETLTTCEQVSRMTPVQARSPVQLRAVVTYFDPVGLTLFVHDKTGGIFVNLKPTPITPHAGELVELTGIAEHPDFAPQVNDASWIPLGKAPFPVALPATYPQMASTSLDSRWVEVEGIVRETAHLHRNATENLLWMKLAVDIGQVDVFLPWKNEMAQDLVDAKVRIRGVCGADYNAKNQQVGVQLYVPDLKQITVIAPATPFDPSPAPVVQLQRFGSRYSFGHRVRVSGTITAALPGQGFYLRDASACLYVGTRQDLVLKPGDRIEVLGFVQLFESHVRLEDASAKVIAAGEPPQALGISLDQAMSGAYDSDLVSLEGRVVRSSVWRQRTTLTLHQNKNIF